MNKRIKNKWLKALRSGAYFQGSGQLLTEYETLDGKTEHHFCCLGVLENLMCEEKGIGFFEDRPGNKSSGTWDDGYHSKACANWADLPVEIRKKSPTTHSMVYNGPAKKNPTHITVDNPVVEDIARMNDSGMSFKKIADWIEKHL